MAESVSDMMDPELSQQTMTNIQSEIDEDELPPLIQKSYTADCFNSGRQSRKKAFFNQRFNRSLNDDTSFITTSFSDSVLAGSGKLITIGVWFLVKSYFCA